MQMAKGCVKNEKKIEILGRWRTILALEFKRKKTVDYDFIHSRHCLVWHGSSKKIWVVCTLGYEVSHLSLSSSKVVTGELHSCMRNPGQLSPDLGLKELCKVMPVAGRVTQLNPSHFQAPEKHQHLTLTLGNCGQKTDHTIVATFFF